MAITHLAPTTHVIPLTMVRRERRMPAPGTILKRAGERISAIDVLAEAEPGPRHFFIDIARGLGVPEREVPKHLVHERGVRIEAGEVIAGPVGISRRTLRAQPMGGSSASSGAACCLRSPAASMSCAVASREP